MTVTSRVMRSEAIKVRIGFVAVVMAHLRNPNVLWKAPANPIRKARARRFGDEDTVRASPIAALQKTLIPSTFAGKTRGRSEYARVHSLLDSAFPAKEHAN